VNAVPEIRRDEQGRRIFEPDGKVLSAFLIDRSPVSIIRGPWGSGTSSACCMRLWQHACEQAPMSDGIRRTRFIVTRESYPQLETTTIKTWQYWFPERVYGKFYTGKKPYLHDMRVGDVHCEVYFAAYEDEDEENLLSLEPTGWWFNELKGLSLNFFTSAVYRGGRYPPAIEGGPTWTGAIADLNAPNETHWLPQMMAEVPLPEDISDDERIALQRPEGWAYFVQPPAVFEVRDAGGRTTGWQTNPQAENLRYLGHDYYDKRIAGKNKRWILQYYGNKVMPLIDGEPVWTSYYDETHKAPGPLEPVAGHKVKVGLDFGRRPAALFGQEIGNRWFIQFELTAIGMSSTEFAPLVLKLLQERYNGYDVEFWGDPKGADKGQATDRSSYDVFRSFGMPVRPAPVKGNHIQTRLDTVTFVLNGMVDGQPRILISPRCVKLLVAMNGAYRYPKEKETTSEEERKPIKDQWSDISDGLQYLLLGGGEGRQMLGLTAANRPKPQNTRAKRRSRRRTGRGG
jgi:hypothetical protein